MTLTQLKAYFVSQNFESREIPHYGDGFFKTQCGITIRIRFSRLKAHVEIKHPHTVKAYDPVLRRLTEQTKQWRQLHAGYFKNIELRDGRIHGIGFNSNLQLSSFIK